MYCGKCGEEGHWYARCPNGEGANVRAQEPSNVVTLSRTEYEALLRGDCPKCEAKKVKNRERMKRKRDAVS